MQNCNLKFKNHPRQQSGFSLLELLIYIAIFSIMAVVIASVFLFLNKGRGKSEAIAEINSNLRFGAEKIIQDIRLASAVTIPASAGATSDTLTMNVSGQNLTYCVSSGQLRRQAGGTCGGSSEAITGTAVIVDSVIFKRFENTNTTLSKTIVSIETNLTLSYNSASPDWRHSASRKFTAALR